MALNTFTAYQPTCDTDGCKYVIEGDGPVWFRTPEDAAESWRDSEGWTDGKTWVCEKHVYEPHALIPDGFDYCERCKIDADEHGPDQAEAVAK